MLPYSSLLLLLLLAGICMASSPSPIHTTPHHTAFPTTPHHTTPHKPTDADRIKQLEQVTEHLARQLMLQQLYVDERTRSEGDSGIKQIRMRINGAKVYDTESHCGGALAAIHDHSNYINTLGLGEMIAVLNGVEFRTRHNDYKLKMPDHSKSYHATKDIPFPPVPPSVLHQPTVEKQSAELREYFKAWQAANVTHRDYRPYFKAALCYMEGAWTLDEHIQEPFESDRHHVDASSWFDLQEKIRYTSATGDRLNTQNYAYLPTTIYNVSRGIPLYAQWNYRILCHPLKDEVNLHHLVPVDDLGHRLSRNFDQSRYLKSRMARFAVDEKPGHNQFYSWNLLDNWMGQIPGKDNYGANITDDSFDLPKRRLDQPDVALNTAYYHRSWKVSKRDAMGDTNAHRGFADRNLFVAENTQPRIAPTHLRHCYIHFGKQVCFDLTKRMSYAIPLEVVFMTPLQSWNPYEIQYRGNYHVPITAHGRDGGTSAAKAYNGTDNRKYYLTPLSFFNGEEVASDPADTTRSATGVLDRHGNVKLMKSSGFRVQLPNIEGVGILRTRYPIMPVHMEGSGIYKELEALRDVVMDLVGHKKVIDKPPAGLNSYTASPSHHTG